MPLVDIELYPEDVVRLEKAAALSGKSISETLADRLAGYVTSDAARVVKGLHNLGRKQPAKDHAHASV